MLRRTFLSFIALIPFGKCLAKQEKTGYIPANSIKTEEEAAQELYRKFKKKDDFGCKELQLTFNYILDYQKDPKKCVSAVVVHWRDIKFKTRNKVSDSGKYTAELSFEHDLVSVSTDYLNEEKLFKCIKKRFSGYIIDIPFKFNNTPVTVSDDSPFFKNSFEV